MSNQPIRGISKIDSLIARCKTRPRSASGDTRALVLEIEHLRRENAQLSQDFARLVQASNPKEGT